jgi:N-ethylmaleimide reductase
MPDLFAPIALGPHTLKNRIAMAPLTRNRAGPGNVPTALNATYYAQRASAGLIISEGAQIAADAVGYPGTPGIHNAEQVAGWRLVTAAVHERDGRIFCQLWHCGRVSHPALLPDGKLPVAPSAIAPRGETFTPQGMQPFVVPRALAREEIPAIIEHYRHAARCARDAGFDGVEIHGANGYLIDQFLRDGSNHRTDEYGGPIENRVRFLLEVTAAVCEVWGPERVGVRLSPLQPFNDMADSNPEATFSHAVDALNRFGLGYLHITEMGKDAPGAAGPAFDLRRLRRLWRAVYMTNGGYTRDTANAAIARGDADMIAFGALYIANPDLVERFARGAPLNTPDPATFYGGDAHGYTDYPFLADPGESDAAA